MVNRRDSRPVRSDEFCLGFIVVFWFRACLEAILPLKDANTTWKLPFQLVPKKGKRPRVRRGSANAGPLRGKSVMHAAYYRVCREIGRDIPPDQALDVLLGVVKFNTLPSEPKSAVVENLSALEVACHQTSFTDFQKDVASD